MFEIRGFSLTGLSITVYYKACELDLESHVKHDSIPVPLSANQSASKVGLECFGNYSSFAFSSVLAS